MTDSSWGGSFGDADEDTGYKAWRTSKTGAVRDLSFIPAPGSGQPRRGESYFQVVSWELNAAETELVLMFHTSGQLVLIEGRGLGTLAEKIVEKRVASVHVWSEAEHGAAPHELVNSVRFDKTFGSLMGSNEGAAS